MACARNCVLMAASALALALVFASDVGTSCRAAASCSRRAGLRQAPTPSVDKYALAGANSSNPSGNRRSGAAGRPGRFDVLRKWKVHPLLIQLGVVVEKYNLLGGKLENIYAGVRGCGLDGCQNFRHFIPAPGSAVGSGISGKKLRHADKQVRQLLLKFHKGLTRIERSFVTMIKYEHFSRFYNETRLNILNELKGDLKTLSRELATGAKGRSASSAEDMSRIYPFPSQQSDLMIQEWYVIRGSRRFLTEWQGIVRDAAILRRLRAVADRKR